MIRAGMKDEVMTSASTFFCVSCYKCTVRCPRGIKPASIVHAVEAIAEREGFHPRTRTMPLYRSLRDGIRRGRLWELGTFIGYYVRVNPLTALGAVPTAWALFSHGRLKLLPPKKVKGGDDVVKIIQKLKSMRTETGGAK
jgi:heterodisulfide reductase subunit C